MTTAQIIELAVAAALIIVAVRQYVRRSREGSRYGSQSAVFLLLVGALIAMHGLGLFNYRPSQSEIDHAQARRVLQP